MEKSFITVESVEWLYDHAYTMIVANIIIDDQRYEAAEYYDAVNDRICTDADAHMYVNGIYGLHSGEIMKLFYPGQDAEEELFWMSVEDQIIAAMRAFVDANTSLAA